jgi:phytoene dehydrogenase-like protein
MTCPYDAIVTDGRARIIEEKCTDCNLCVHACPNDCLVPEKPIKTRRQPVADQYDVVIIGAGIGGLMAGAALAQAGRAVAVFEKLGFAGGRYTELKYKGVPVTTAAWTSLGPKCNIGRFLSDLGIEDGPDGMDYVSLRDVGLEEQYSISFPDGRHFASLLDMLSPEDKRAWLKAIIQAKREAPTDVTAHDFFARYSDNPDFLSTVDAIAATASSISSHAMPVSEFVTVVLDARDVGADFATPRGGIKKIIEQLVHMLESAGGKVFLRRPVAHILVEDGRAAGVELDDGYKVSAPIVVHNGGPMRLLRLLDPAPFPEEYLSRLTSLQGAECAAFFFATRELLYSDAPMLMTPNCQRVVGVWSPTVLDPELGPNGVYLYDAFLPLQGSDRGRELELVEQDLRALFPAYDDVLLWSLPMFFVGTWPGTESGQVLGQVGEQRLSPRTPVEGLFLAGMDVQGSGAAGDLIPMGVRKLLQELDCPFPAR